MATESGGSSKSSKKSEEKRPEQDPANADLSPSTAEAPGPITPEHESGSWEQTIEDRKKKGLNPDGTPAD